MERKGLLDYEHKILNHLTYLPRKILSLNDRENITEFVLHDLCGQDCFNLEKAAYFVDNPDFDCLKGVAGFSRVEAYPDSCNIWETPKAFSVHMSKAPFNQKVRNMYKESMKKSHKKDDVIASEIAQDLGFENHTFYSWDMKHYNHGILIFERENINKEHDKYLLNGISLLSFCPIF